ncbi:LacI family DNA-binding transcriptional regulator [Adhaeribacter radiodurans]|uniref:LacI family DNA-binding transcriptional regulator n=1 Tax=Adhaeribacter radiodurans TaxID=2745197 RepID=A0A7L7L6X8_9BACT|nr:LacI family DNA-binding transcriptional regulator [Adhaeribacter radiodurans]QMU28557.1 LacI family DNA-binding transcriptional regulator [Adhaeribacter radiodurans]
MEKKNIRIKDIAQLAGVSSGTVDRVLHNRGKVSEEALQKVLQTLKEIDYKPNLIARTLGTKKNFRIAVIIPDPSLDEYWAHSELGVRQAITDWHQYDVQIKTYFFDLYHKHSFEQVTHSVFHAKPDGVVIAPIFYHEALPFLQQCQANKIPFTVFNTNIPEVAPLSFIGQNLYESGRVAAELMCLGNLTEGIFAILHINEDSVNSIHLLDKQKGFEEYVQEKKLPDVKIKVLNIKDTEDPKDTKGIHELLLDDTLAGVYVTTSKGVSFIAELLYQKKQKAPRLIGYDLLPENIKYLEAGTISFLINQNAKHQTFLGVQQLVNYLFLKKEPPQNNLLPLEIITKENLSSYLRSAVPHF